MNGWRYNLFWYLDIVLCVDFSNYDPFNQIYNLQTAICIMRSFLLALNEKMSCNKINAILAYYACRCKRPERLTNVSIIHKQESNVKPDTACILHLHGIVKLLLWNGPLYYNSDCIKYLCICIIITLFTLPSIQLCFILCYSPSGR